VILLLKSRGSDAAGDTAWRILFPSLLKASTELGHLGEVPSGPLTQSATTKLVAQDCDSGKASGKSRSHGPVWSLGGTAIGWPERARVVSEPHARESCLLSVLGFVICHQTMLCRTRDPTLRLNRASRGRGSRILVATVGNDSSLGWGLLMLHAATIPHEVDRSASCPSVCRLSPNWSCAFGYRNARGHGR
jgi:hypothetical protein